jgi:hypothetical protein
MTIFIFAFSRFGVLTRDETKLGYIGKGYRCVGQITCIAVSMAEGGGGATGVMWGTIHLEGRHSVSNWPRVELGSPYFEGNRPVGLCSDW